MAIVYTHDGKPVTTTNPLPVTSGTVASGDTNTGNPTKIGGVFNTTMPTVTDGQVVDIQTTNRGIVKVELGLGTGGATAASGSVTNADGQAVSSVGNKLEIVARDTVFNGSTWDRMPGDTNAVKVEQRFLPARISTATTTVVKGSAGFLHSIVVNTTAAGSITVYNNTSATGTIVAVLKASIVEGTYLYDVTMSTGITIVTAGASDITVTYR